jgi:hypothetical protein
MSLREDIIEFELWVLVMKVVGDPNAAERSHKQHEQRGFTAREHRWADTSGTLRREMINQLGNAPDN